MRRLVGSPIFFVILALCFSAGLALHFGTARAAFTKYDTETYDIDSLGLPKFVNTNYIELNKITQLSKFRSSIGHEYSDVTQFNTSSYRDPVTRRIEGCSSMKHYFMSPDDTVKVYAPVSGVVSRMFDEAIGGTQVQITSDVQPAFTFTIFHVVLTPYLAEGDRVTEGQLLGHHTGTQTWSDIAVIVHTPGGYHLVSYFEVLTDAAFAPFKARGIASPSELAVSKEFRAANPFFSCAGKAQLPLASDYVSLTGGAATQTITPPALLNTIARVGDAPVSVAATATSGLPVTVTSQQPKGCPIADGMVSWKKAGICIVTFSQAGNAETFAAPSRQYTITVTPKTAPPSQVRLGGMIPPGQSATQSYLRFFNTGTEGAVTVSLLDGDTGQAIAKWKSPAIPSNASPQFSITDLESAATPGFTRPRIYGLRVEPETTIFGYMQHVLYNSVVGSFTNASSCNTGITGNPIALQNVHSSLFADYPSAIVLANQMTGGHALGTETRLADSGALAGPGLAVYYPSRDAIPSYAQVTLLPTKLETQFNIAPGLTSARYNVKSYNGTTFGAYLQHIVTSKRPNVIADMTTVCDVRGYTVQTTQSPLFTNSVYSSSNAGAQSFFRFYNAGATAGTVSVTLRDVDSGAALGQWTSPSIPAGAQNQYAVATIEAETNITKKSIYTATVQTDIDGYFQHVLFRMPNGALSNFSTCGGSVTTDPSTLISVHSSLVGAAGYPSQIVVNNSGTEAAQAVLDIIDARDGHTLASYTTAQIPAEGQAQVDVATMEKGAALTPTPGMGHYIIKMRAGFNGFLQHFVTNEAAGVITDLTTVCAM